MTLSDIVDFLLKIEGPYKFYVIIGIVTVFTAIFSRIVFKTIKWFVILVCLVVIGTAIWTYLIK